MLHASGAVGALAVLGVLGAPRLARAQDSSPRSTAADAPSGVAHGLNTRDFGGVSRGASTGDAADVDVYSAMTLAEAIRLAIGQNPAVIAARVDERVAEARVVEASGLDDVVVDANSGAVSNHAPVAAGASSSPFDRFSAGAGVTQPLPIGGKLGLRLVADFTQFEQASRGFAGAVSSQTMQGASNGFAVSGPSTVQLVTPSLLFTFSQPLLKNAGVSVARADRRRARVSNDVAALQKQATLARVLRDVTHTYWELGYASAELEIRRASVELAREQLRAVQANIAVGKQAPSSAAEVEVTIALREGDLLLAEQAVRSQSYELRRLVGLGLGPAQPALVAADQPDGVFPRRPLDQVLAATLERNPDLRALRAQIRAALIDVDVARNGLLPQLDFSVAAGPVGNADRASTAFSQLGNGEGYTVQAALTFSHPVGRHAAEGRARAAEQTLRKARVSEADLMAQLQATVYRTVDLVAIAERRLEVLVRATDVAAVDLTAEKARFESGRASNFEVLRRQGQLALAQLSQARARTDYAKAFAALEALTTENVDRWQAELR